MAARSRLKSSPRASRARPDQQPATSEATGCPRDTGEQDGSGDVFGTPLEQLPKGGDRTDDVSVRLLQQQCQCQNLHFISGTGGDRIGI